MADNNFRPFNLNITYSFVKEMGPYRLNLELYTTQHSLRCSFPFYYKLLLLRTTPLTASFSFSSHDSGVHTLTTNIILYVSMHVSFGNR